MVRLLKPRLCFLLDSMMIPKPPEWVHILVEVAGMIGESVSSAVAAGRGQLELLGHSAAPTSRPKVDDFFRTQYRREGWYRHRRCAKCYWHTCDHLMVVVEQKAHERATRRSRAFGNNGSHRQQRMAFMTARSRISWQANICMKRPLNTTRSGPHPSTYDRSTLAMGSNSNNL